jgi:hypothetical protein
VYALQHTRTKCGALASYKAREIDRQPVTDYLGSTRVPLAETSERHGRFVNTFECLLRILSRRRCWDTATDFGPTALRLTGAAQALVEVSASALIWAWAMGAVLPWLSPSP